MKKDFIKKLGFYPKENFNNIFIKKYKNNYILEVDFEKQSFNYGDKIKLESKTTQNFSQDENWVVFECVNRFLEKGYNAEDIILEKVFPTGHGTSGRLDILIKKDGKSFLMIECKTWGKEFDKEFNNMKRNGGQLFTYFQQDRNAEFLVLYASNDNLEYINEIVKVEEHYKETTSVVDFYDRWNKLTKQNGIFEEWIEVYNFESRALTKKDLKPIKGEDASIIFNSFLEILRKNTVSDKPNAFNKIFTLFLCKIYDEGDKRDDEELSFQWIEGKDNHIDFQLKLTDLYKKGMQKLLEKEVSILSNDEFNNKFGEINEIIRIKILEEFNKLRLEQNNEFAIKDVFDKETFEENAIVLKEVVELLQTYQIRYEEKQPFLGDFFELLLTTGLKQEAGQFFTPVPVAKFICKSIPINKIINDKLEKGNSKDLLPSVIDYAAGSGHFLTESMEEIQTILKGISKDNLKPDVLKKVKSWDGNFDWAYDYMYGIEKDYRLVKTAKVGCFLHGDGIANVIHGDGLDSFENSKKYRGLLKKFTLDDKKENAQFDLVLSNPPYSVGAFKSNLKEYAKDDFELFSKLTETSSEIESLFIERTSQLLKEGGIAGIILPSSILSNTGIYIEAREIILKNFYIISIVELGTNTFMATPTKTVILFLRKRNKYFAKNLEFSVDNFFANFQDTTLNGIEKSISKYINEVWEGLSFEDYVLLLQKKPSENIIQHEVFKDYQSKIKLTKNKEEDRKKEFFEKIIEIEKEKLFYFILTYSQKLVLVKSGEKKIEKEFLGYEFSNGKGKGGIHSVQGGDLIDDSTKLFDPNNLNNPNKINTYICDSFENNHKREISSILKDHIFRIKLSDYLNFETSKGGKFEKKINKENLKELKIDSKWDIVKLSCIIDIIRGITYSKESQITNSTNNIILPADNITLDGKLIIKKEIFLKSSVILNGDKKLLANDIFICFSSGSLNHLGKIAYIQEDTNYYAGGFMGILRKKLNSNINMKYLYNLLNSSIYRDYIRTIGTGANINNLSSVLYEQKIPLPPEKVQQKIVYEIEELEEKAKTVVINDLQKQKENILKKYL